MRIYRGWVRVLLPFNLRVRDSPSILDETLRAAFSNEGSGWLGLDRGSERDKLAHSDYYEEYLPHVHSFLFDIVGTSGCRYLRLKHDRVPPFLAEVSEVWTRNLTPVGEKSRIHTALGSPSLRGLQMIGIAAEDPVWKAPAPFDSPKRRLPLLATLDANSGVEMWISQLGAGLLSISFMCEPAGDDASQDDSFFHGLLQLNHALATAHQSVWLRAANAAETTAQSETAAGSASGAQAIHRNSGEANTLHLHQFVRDLLRPLRTEAQVLFDQRGLAYLAIEVQQPEDSNADFQRELTQKLSHLAQLHPSSHPGEGETRHGTN